CDDAIARLSRALGLTIFGTVVGAGISLFAFGILGPLVAIKVLIVGTLIAIGQKKALANYQRQAEALRAELRQREAELRGLEGKLALLKQLEALLEAQKSVIGDIASRISQISQIWTVIQNDAIQISAKIQEVEEEEEFAQVVQLVRDMRDIYSPLHEALRLYSTETASALRP
ncbi:hypothetical protein FRC11_012627, partial [Ceratobasidium sp. 423]